MEHCVRWLKVGQLPGLFRSAFLASLKVESGIVPRILEARIAKKINATITKLRACGMMGRHTKSVRGNEIGRPMSQDRVFLPLLASSP